MAREEPGGGPLPVPGRRRHGQATLPRATTAPRVTTAAGDRGPAGDRDRGWAWVSRVCWPVFASSAPALASWPARRGFRLPTASLECILPRRTGR